MIELPKNNGFTWRILAEQEFAPAFHVALDEAILEQVVLGRSPPTIRFWKWASSAIVLGRCQSVSNEIDSEGAQELGMAIVRRMTGGGAMVLQPHGAITYSMILPESALDGYSLRQSYEACDSWAVAALREMGIDCWYAPINDIASAAGKIAGAAQARRRGFVLHHTTLAYDLENATMLRVLRHGREKLRSKGVPSAEKVVASLKHLTPLSRDAMASRLLETFERNFGGIRSKLTEMELESAERFRATKYATAEWTHEFE